MVCTFRITRKVNLLQREFFLLMCVIPIIRFYNIVFFFLQLGKRIFTKHTSTVNMQSTNVFSECHDINIECLGELVKQSSSHSITYQPCPWARPMSYVNTYLSRCGVSGDSSTTLLSLVIIILQLTGTCQHLHQR